MRLFSVVKEGGLETLLSVAKVVVVGSCITNFVCYTLWPQTAYSGLQNNITRTLDSFATLLDLLTKTFLISDNEVVVSQSHLQRAVNDHQSSFTSLKKNLTEARGEWLLGGADAAQAYEDAVGCMNRLAQHLNGLRSGTRLPAELANAAREGKIVLGKIAADTGKRNGAADGAQKDKSDEAVTLQVAAHIFEELVDDMGPPLKALSVHLPPLLSSLILTLSGCRTHALRLFVAYGNRSANVKKHGRTTSIGSSS